MADLVELELTCRCKQLTASVEVPASTLPLPLLLCHCNTCNAVTGQLCATVCQIPDGSTPIRINGEAKGYKTSAAIERFFCEKCGTSVYEDASGLSFPMMFLDSGSFSQGELKVLDKIVPIFEAKEHIFVGDTQDGGLQEWMTDITAWEGWPGNSKKIAPGNSCREENISGPMAGDELRCACKCGGVKFSISRPEQGSSHWPNPAESEKAASSIPISKGPDWWKPGGGTKYNAFLCACNDCRASSGYEISAYAIIPKNNFRVQTDVTPDNHRDLEAASTLSDYESSPGVHRQFCGRCGATLGFFNDHMPNTINVSVGLMQGKNGTRCEDWLEWHTAGIGHAKLAQNKSFINSLSSGYSRWNTTKAQV